MLEVYIPAYVHYRLQIYLFDFTLRQKNILGFNLYGLHEIRRVSHQNTTHPRPSTQYQWVIPLVLSNKHSRTQQEVQLFSVFMKTINLSNVIVIKMVHSHIVIQYNIGLAHSFKIM